MPASEPVDLPPPRATGRETIVDLTGGLIPYRDGQPTLMAVPGSDYLYMPVFSTMEKLQAEEASGRLGTVTDIKQIEDHHECLSSIPQYVKVMYDPWVCEGRSRWIEVQQPDGEFGN